MVIKLLIPRIELCFELIYQFYLFRLEVFASRQCRISHNIGTMSLDLPRLVVNQERRESGLLRHEDSIVEEKWETGIDAKTGDYCTEFE
jgi:hypothetical protein